MTSVTIGPSPCDIQVYAGDRNEITFRFQAGGDPWNITGAVLSAQARLTSRTPEIAITAIITVTDAINGTALVAWDGEQVRTLLAGADTWTGTWDFQLLEAGQSLPLTVLRGKFTAILDITRAGA